MRKPFEQDFPITQKFGENPEAYKKFGLVAHNGLDYALPENTNIIAPITGTVVEVGWDATGYGLYMKIENDKEGCLLGHLTDNLLAVNTHCDEGQLIAHSGNTGNSSGPHIHLGYYLLPRDRQNGYAGYIDPAPFLDPHLKEIADLKQELKEYKDGLDVANKRIKELEEQLKNAPVAPVTPPVPETPVQVTITDPEVAEIKQNVGYLVKFADAIKKFFSMKLEW